MSNFRQWLEELSLDQYADAFEENDIGVALIPSLDHDVLKDIGVSIAGHRLKILNAAKHLSDASSPPAREAAQKTSPGRYFSRKQYRMAIILTGSQSNLRSSPGADL